MITLNLLPDIKKDYLRSQRVKRLFLFGATLVSAAFIAMAILLALFVFGAQRLHLNRVQSDIDQTLADLKAQPDIDKIVTIQKQLEVLPGLHDDKPAGERLFTYLGLVVPQDITLSNVEIDLADENVAILTGAGPNPRAINVFVDTLKNATFEYDGIESPINPFTRVVLENVAVEEEETTYAINIEYDTVLFDTTLDNVKLTVPKITSSTSVQQRPVLFRELESEEEQ